MPRAAAEGGPDGVDIVPGPVLMVGAPPAAPRPTTGWTGWTGVWLR